jgi:hypothetical protein
MMTLQEVARELARRLSSLFLPDATGARPVHGADRRYADDPHFRDLALFYEYFHGDTGRGVGASHQTGWTALVVKCLEEVARARGEAAACAAPMVTHAASAASSRRMGASVGATSRMRVPPGP